jgi:hypothetical protein
VWHTNVLADVARAQERFLAIGELLHVDKTLDRLGQVAHHSLTSEATHLLPLGLAIAVQFLLLPLDRRSRERSLDSVAYAAVLGLDQLGVDPLVTDEPLHHAQQCRQLLEFRNA